MTSQPTTDGAASAAHGDEAQIVDAAIDEVGHFATLPAIVSEIIRLTEDPDPVPQELNEVISSDPALVARVLKVANSSFYGCSRQIGSINLAVMLLGLNSVKYIAIAASLDKLFRGGQIAPDFNAPDLWTHSIAVATGARLLTEKSGLGLPDKAFLAGLIHDLGIMVEVQARRPKFIEVIDKLVDDPSLTFRQAEEQTLGATHEAFGAGLCRRWNFPVTLEHVAGYHHRPMELADARGALTAVVNVADILAARIGAGYVRTVETDTFDPQILDSASLTTADVDAVAAALPAAVSEALQLFCDNVAPSLVTNKPKRAVAR